MNPIEISISQKKPFGKIKMQVKSNVIRGMKAERRRQMAEIIDASSTTIEKVTLPRVKRWKVYNLLHCFHPDTYDSWRAVGGRKTDGEYYECYHDEHVVSPSSINHYGRAMNNPLLIRPTLEEHIFCFEDFAEIHHSMKIMTLHTEYLHEQGKCIIEYSLRHDRFPDPKIYDMYREWVIYVLSTKGATKGKAIPFRCEAILETHRDPKHWIYVFIPPETFTIDDGPTQPAWRIHLYSREGMLEI